MLPADCTYCSFQHIKRFSHDKNLLSQSWIDITMYAPNSFNRLLCAILSIALNVIEAAPLCMQKLMISLWLLAILPSLR